MTANGGIVSRTDSRISGWSWPPHPFQCIAWGFIIFLALMYYLVLTPSVIEEWMPACYIIMSLILLSQITCLIVSTSLNPADSAVLAKMRKERLQPGQLDRTLHQHAIVEQHCYLCNVEVGMGSKHCRACNKCVGNFDHHCKWLNNCIGSRNYKWFLATLVTSFAGTISVLVLSFTLFIAYFVDQDSGNILQPYLDVLYIDTNGTSHHSSEPDFHAFYLSVPDELWITLLAITWLLTLVAALLLGHLFIFHIFLIHKGLTTYDYIVQERELAEKHAREKDLEESKGQKATFTCASNKANQVNPSNDQSSSCTSAPRNAKKSKGNDHLLENEGGSSASLQAITEDYMREGLYDGDNAYYMAYMQQDSVGSRSVPPNPPPPAIHQQDENSPKYNHNTSHHDEASNLDKLRQSKRSKKKRRASKGEQPSSVYSITVPDRNSQLPQDGVEDSDDESSSDENLQPNVFWTPRNTDQDFLPMEDEMLSNVEEELILTASSKARSPVIKADDPPFTSAPIPLLPTPLDVDSSTDNAGITQKQFSPLPLSGLNNLPKASSSFLDPLDAPSMSKNNARVKRKRSMRRNKGEELMKNKIDDTIPEEKVTSDGHIQDRMEKYKMATGDCPDENKTSVIKPDAQPPANENISLEKTKAENTEMYERKEEQGTNGASDHLNDQHLLRLNALGIEPLKLPNSDDEDVPTLYRNPAYAGSLDIALTSPRILPPLGQVAGRPKTEINSDSDESLREIPVSSVYTGRSSRLQSSGRGTLGGSSRRRSGQRGMSSDDSGVAHTPSSTHSTRSPGQHSHRDVPPLDLSNLEENEQVKTKNIPVAKKPKKRKEQTVI